MTSASNTDSFNPNWVSLPGDTIRDLLKEHNLSVSDLADTINKPRSFVEKLLRGHEAINQEVANLLEEALGSSAEFWLNREAQYRNDAQRLNIQNNYKDEEEWLRQLPLADMQKFGWLTLPKGTEDRVVACLDYFGVANIEAWKNKYKNAIEMAAFRTSESFDSDLASVSTWYRQGERLAERINSKNWNPQLFQEKLAGIKKLTRKKDPKIFLPLLTKLCAECGVCVVFVRSPKNCRASGVTRFISKHRALMILSFRHLSDDQFWFTFFHEAAHLLLHNNRPMYIDDGSYSTGIKNVDKEEQEANDFAANYLVPPEFHQELKSLRFGIHDLPRFSKKVGVSSGIIIGQLQHMGILERNQKNWFKKYFKWEDLDEAISLASK